MAQYHNLDDSGDPGLSGSESSTRYFALAMVQLAENAPLPELAEVRKVFHFQPTFEFKYHNTTAAHKESFFKAVKTIPFRVRSLVVDKTHLGKEFADLDGPQFGIEFIARLTMRASELDIANDVLIIDGAGPAFCRALRIRLSKECRERGRARPFRKIVGGKSKYEDGLQLADMIAGAIRQHVMRAESKHYETFEEKVADLWELL